jgi:enoyl-CoA hydratase
MSTIRVDDREGGVRLLTLDRPPANAIERTLLTDLSAALDDAHTDDAVRALALTGAGEFFSGGLELAELPRDGRSMRLLLDLYRDSHVKLLTFPKPTGAMVNGHAIAGGLVMLLACDCRLGVAGDYRFGVNEVAIGAAFPRLPFEIIRLRLTHAQASELLLGAALYPPSHALRLGVMDELLPAESFEATVLSRAAHLGAYPREAYAHTKAALVAEAVARAEAETDEEIARAAAVWMMPESLAAREAQQKKQGKGTFTE